MESEVCEGEESVCVETVSVLGGHQMSKERIAGVGKTEALPVVKASDVPAPLRPETEAIREGLAKSLASYEAALQKSGQPATGLEKIWRDSFRYSDTNEVVRIHLMEIHVMLQKAMREFFAAEERRMLELGKMQREAAAKLEPAMVELYVKARECMAKEKREEMKTIMQLADTARKLSDNFRKAELQQAYFLHVSRVQQFTLLVMGLIHQHVHDPNALAGIQNQMRDAWGKLKPKTIEAEESAVLQEEAKAEEEG